MARHALLRAATHFVVLTLAVSAGLAAYRQNTPAELTVEVEVTESGPGAAGWLRLQYERPDGSRFAIDQVLLSTRAGDGSASYRVNLLTARRIKALWGSVAGRAVAARVMHLGVRRHGEHAVPIGAIDSPGVTLGGDPVMIADGLGPYTGFSAQVVPATVWPSAILSAAILLLWARGRWWAGNGLRWAGANLDGRALRIAALALLLAGATSVEWRLAILSSSNASRLSPTEKAAVLADPVLVDLLVYAAVLCGAMWMASRSRVGSRSTTAIFLACAFALTWLAIGAFRASDVAHFHYAGRHIDLMSLRHAQGSALDLRPDLSVVTMALLQGVGAAVSAALLIRAVLLAAAAGRPRRAALSAALVSAAVLVLLAIPAGMSAQANTLETRARLQNANAARAFPEAALLWSLMGSEAQGLEAELSAPLLAKLAAFGWSAKPSSPFPLQREAVFATPPRLVPREGAGQPLNVIVIFLESFSLAFTSLEGGRFPHTTPNLVEFAKTGMQAPSFYNSSTPTVNGIVSTLCSYYLPTQSGSWYLGRNDFTDLYCLPRVLRGRGYHTQFNLVVERSYLQMGWLLENLGFERVLDVRDIAEGLHEAPLSWGMSDHQLFRHLVKGLQSGAHASPFLVSLVTIDSHPPFNLARDMVAPSGESSPVLRTISSTDHAFGEFWRYFRSSPYFRNTMVVVLGDHQMFPGRQAADTAADPDARTFYGRVPLLVYDPTHQLPETFPGLASQVDVAPTILHLMGVNGANAFEGNSLFEDRSRITGVLSMHESLFFTLQASGDGLVRDTFGPSEASDACAVAARPAAGLLTRCDYYQWYRWKAALHARNRVWP